MGKSDRDTPPQPKYIEPEPVKSVGLQDPYETQFRTDVMKRLAGSDADWNNYSMQSDDAFRKNLASNLDKTYGQYEQNAIDNITKRLGGVNTSVTTDTFGRLADARAQAETSAYNDYILGQPERYLNYQNALLNQANLLANREKEAELLGIQKTNPQNQYNLGAYNTQLSYLASQPQSNILNDLVGPAVSAAGTTAMYLSDKKAKYSIKKIDEKNGINIYEFKYKSKYVDRYNLSKEKQIGVIAQEVEHIPGAVIEKEGTKFVNYDVIFPLIA